MNACVKGETQFLYYCDLPIWKQHQCAFYTPDHEVDADVLSKPCSKCYVGLCCSSNARTNLAYQGDFDAK